MTAPQSSELGSTQNPKELIPGEPEHVEANVRALASEQSTIGEKYDLVRRVAVPGWTGRAAESFEWSFDRELEKWIAYLRLLESARSTLSTYAGALRAAQSEAQRAIDRWNEGERVTAEARATHEKALADYSDFSNLPLMPTSPFGGPIGPIGGAPLFPGPFVDPGGSIRADAQTILSDARRALEEAGEVAVVALGGLEGSNSQSSSSGPGMEGSAEGPSFSWGPDGHTYGQDPTRGPDGTYSDDHDGGPFKLSLGSVEGAMWVHRGQASVEDYWGPVNVHADGTVTLLGLDGSAEATIDKSGLRLDAEGRVVVLGAEGSAGASYGVADAEVTGEVFAGASAEGHVIADATGLHAGGEVFAGARASATAGLDVGGVGGAVTAEAWAGAGAAANLDLGWNDGALTIGASAGVAWGVGAKLGGEVTLDFPEMWETGTDIVEGIGGWFD